jgi:hypothetical protein
MPIKPPSCGLSALLGALIKGGSGGMGKMGGIMSVSSKSASEASRDDTIKKRQLGVAAFLGGGGSEGSGSAFAAKNTTVKSGVYISPSDKFTFMAELVNYDPKEKPIYLSLDYEWVPGKISGLLDVGMGVMGASSCDNLNGLFIPPKDRSITYEGAEWTATQNGYFVNFTPHVSHHSLVKPLFKDIFILIQTP